MLSSANLFSPQRQMQVISLKKSGLGTPTIAGSCANFCTITDNGTGDYTINFTVKPFFNARNNSSSTSVADISFLKDVNGSGGVSLEASGKIIFKENRI